MKQALGLPFPGGRTPVATRNVRPGFGFGQSRMSVVSWGPVFADLVGKKLVLKRLHQSRQFATLSSTVKGRHEATY